MTGDLFLNDPAPQAPLPARQVPPPQVATRPISFTSESIHGIEKDLKTQTRRTIYPQPLSPGRIEVDPAKGYLWRGPDGSEWKCPYGMPGDRLWVREVWARVEPYPDAMEKYEMPAGWWIKKDAVLLQYWQKRVIFLADFPGKMPEECGRGATDNKWRGPLTMPRWASRFLLEVTSIRVERLQEISVEDCIAEGMRTNLREHEACCELKDQYAKIWDLINGEKNPWAANPRVWAIRFRRLT